MEAYQRHECALRCPRPTHALRSTAGRLNRTEQSTSFPWLPQRAQGLVLRSQKLVTRSAWHAKLPFPFARDMAGPCAVVSMHTQTGWRVTAAAAQGLERAAA